MGDRPDYIKQHLLTYFFIFLYQTVKRLHQGHLHPNLKVLRLTCPGRESNPGLRGRRRALWKKRAIRTAFNSYTEHFHISPRQNKALWDLDCSKPVLMGSNIIFLTTHTNIFHSHGFIFTKRLLLIACQLPIIPKMGHCHMIFKLF